MRFHFVTISAVFLVLTVWLVTLGSAFTQQATGENEQTAAASRYINEKDLFDFVWIADPQVSPDGSQVVFYGAVPNQERSAYNGAIWMAATSGDTPPVELFAYPCFSDLINCIVSLNRAICDLVSMSMMYVWKVVMAVHHSFMTMWMAVGFDQRRSLIMLVLMVFVVNVSMIVLNRFMLMLVPVSLSQVQPNANPHQRGSNHKLIA